MKMRKCIEEVVLSLIENNTAGCISRYEVAPTSDDELLVHDNEGNSLKIISKKSIFTKLSANKTSFDKLINLLIENGYKEISI